ncbi:MAG: hypothetical protein H6Q54_978 [Deltaproteobacteria bacterium]|jgi:hypothetical protein|nr:hypothetical protein [Deltaproteobacteria bacterium]MBP1746363.1 hypothetical protein [Deltaproteobacteria bacterium]
MTDQWIDDFTDRIKNIKKILSEIFYGFTVHELDLEMRKEKGHTENLFMLMIFGDLVGLPLLPPYYSLRLFPYIIPAIEGWKRRVLREKDLTDFVAGDL